MGELVHLGQDGSDESRRVELEMEERLVVCDGFDVGVWLELAERMSVSDRKEKKGEKKYCISKNHSHSQRPWKPTRLLYQVT